MTKSKINDKLFKEYKNVDVKSWFEGNEIVNTLSRKQGTKIIRYDDAGKIDRICEHTYFDNGKVKRIANSNKATEFFENGKIRAKEIRKTLDIDKSYMESGQIFDEKGNLLHELKEKTGCNGTTYKSTRYMPDGKRVESEVKIAGLSGSPSRMLSESDIRTRPSTINIFDKSGKRIQRFDFVNYGNDGEMTIMCDNFDGSGIRNFNYTSIGGGSPISARIPNKSNPKEEFLVGIGEALGDSDEHVCRYVGEYPDIVKLFDVSKEKQAELYDQVGNYVKEQFKFLKDINLNVQQGNSYTNLFDNCHSGLNDFLQQSRIKYFGA